MFTRILTRGLSFTVAVLTLTSATSATALTTAPSTQVTGCTVRPAENLAAYDAITDPLVEQGVISKEQQDYARCHPEDLAAASAVSPVVDAPASTLSTLSASQPQLLAAAAVSCGSGFTLKTSLRFTQNDPGLIKPAFRAIYSLGWCYNKKTKKVKDWFGECSGEVTTYGKVQGWAFDGCTTNDFIPYTLNASFPGGIHHSMGINFVNNFTLKTINYTFRESIWGHWDGTCDRKPYQNPVIHWC